MKEETLLKYTQGKEMFLNGYNLSQIETELKINRGRLAKWLNEQGIKTKYTKDESYEKGKIMYLEGASLNDVAEELNVSAMHFSKWLKSQNIEVINPSKVYDTDETYFEIIDTEEKAYWLGFLYADGCVSETVRNDKIRGMVLEIGLAKKDECHLVKFLKAMSSNNPIHDKEVKLNGKLFPCSRVTICSTKICRDLIKLGCTPRKSATLTFPTNEILPTDLVRHFVRGYIDGDGWIGMTTNKRFARVGVCGTHDFLYDMQNVMEWKNTPISRDKRGIHYSTECSITQTLDILDNLYKGSSIYLDRKYNKYENILADLGGNI